MELLVRQCINLIIEDSLNTDSKDTFIAALLVNGLGGVPLKGMSEEDLVQEVYNRLNYMFSTEEDELFSADEGELKKWILDRSCEDWCSKVLY
jgi:hypothetical protein